MSKQTIIIDTDNNTVELLHEGYNIIEFTSYIDDVVLHAKKLLDMIALERGE